MTNRYNSWTSLLSYNSNCSSLHSNNYQIQTIFFLKKTIKIRLLQVCVSFIVLLKHASIYRSEKKTFQAICNGNWPMKNRLPFEEAVQVRKKIVRAKAGATRINLTGEREMLITADSQVYLMTPIHLGKMAADETLNGKSIDILRCNLTKSIEIHTGNRSINQRRCFNGILLVSKILKILVDVQPLSCTDAQMIQSN